MAQVSKRAAGAQGAGAGVARGVRQAARRARGGAAGARDAARAGRGRGGGSQGASRSTRAHGRRTRRRGAAAGQGARRHTAAMRVGRVALLVAVALLLVAPVVLLADPVSYVPLVSAVLLVAVSWAYLQVTRRALSVGVGQMAGSCERGGAVPLGVTLSNAGILPLPRIEVEFFVTDLFGNVDDVRPVTCALGSRETQVLDFDVAFAHLGTYHAGVRRVVVHDLLGLFSSVMDDGARRPVAVRPRKADVESVRRLAAVADDSRSSLRPVMADDLDYAGVREYRYGDSMKAVHWNLSARDPQGVMYTRLFEAYVNPTMAIVIDPYAPDASDEELMSLFDGMVETAAALSARARAAGIEAEVRYVGADGAPAAAHLVSADDADDLIADMMRITPASEAPRNAGVAEDMLRSAALRQHGCGNAVVVTSRPDAGLVEALAEVAMRRRNAMAFLAVPRMLEGKERERFCAPLRRLDEVGAAYYGVESNASETEVCAL